MEEDEVEATILKSEVIQVIKHLMNGKVVGIDKLPIKAVKYLNEENYKRWLSCLTQSTVVGYGKNYGCFLKQA